MRYFTLLLLAALLFGCQPDETTLVEPDCTEGATLSGDADVDRQVLEQLEAEILQLVDRECSNGKKCRTIGFGAKPCGGPWSYLIYSSSSTDEDLLIEKVCAYNAYQDAMNQHYGYFSDCAVEEVPQLQCSGGKCAFVL